MSNNDLFKVYDPAALRASLTSVIRLKRMREYTTASTDSNPLLAKLRSTGPNTIPTDPATTAALQVIPIDPTTLKNRGMHATRALPSYHRSWHVTRVVAGHDAPVHCVCVDSSNDWFVSGSADRTVKVWDLVTGKLKLTLTGHIQAVRGVSLSGRIPYMFTCSEDKTVRCWDLERNEVVRTYHGHLGGVYSIAIHPDLDLIATGGTDGAVRVWDIRTRKEIYALLGHKEAVQCLLMQSSEPQIVSGGADAMVRLWDLAAGRCYPDGILTQHKRGVRCMAWSPLDYTMASCSSDSLRKWRLPSGKYLHGFEGGCAAEGGGDTAPLSGLDIPHSCAVNPLGVFVTGHASGAVKFFDWASAQCFSTPEKVTPQPGSRDSEGSVMAMTFDGSGSRLITGHGDKTLRVWVEQ